MAEQLTVDQRLCNVAAGIAAIDLDSLTHPVAGMPFHFESELPIFHAILTFYREMATSKLNFVPVHKLENMLTRAEQLLAKLGDVTRFDYKRGDPQSNRNQLAGYVTASWHECYDCSASHLALARIVSSSMKQEVEDLRSARIGIQAEWKKASDEYLASKKLAEDQIAARTVELEKVVAAAREVSATRAVSAQATEFQLESEEYAEAAFRWFWTTVSAVALSLIVVWWVFLKAPMTEAKPNLISSVAVSNQTAAGSVRAASAATEGPVDGKLITPHVVQQTLARIMIVTLLYSAVIWCGRNYFACRHNYTVNRHRRNAMQTFRAFVEGTKDTATQDFILRQAASCAFASQQTGYLKDESLPTPAASSQIIDIVKPGGGPDH